MLTRLDHSSDRVGGSPGEAARVYWIFSEHQGTCCCSLFAQRDEEEEGNEKHGEGRELTGTQEVLGGFGGEARGGREAVWRRRRRRGSGNKSKLFPLQVAT